MKVSADPDAGARGPASIMLIGMPGAGKSTVGPALALRLGRPWLDSGDEIERRLDGGSLRAYFTRHGEPAFRDLEQQVAIELAARRGCVVGTGGGSVLRGASRDALKSRSVAVYLHATPEVLARRLRGDALRPLLQGDDPLRRLEALLAQRHAFYRATAHFIVETDRLDVPATVDAIVWRLATTGTVAQQPGRKKHFSGIVGIPTSRNRPGAFFRECQAVE